MAHLLPERLVETAEIQVGRQAQVEMVVQTLLMVVTALNPVVAVVALEIDLEVQNPAVQEVQDG
jgi:hypothetical protein